MSRPPSSAEEGTFRADDTSQVRDSSETALRFAWQPIGKRNLDRCTSAEEGSFGLCCPVPFMEQTTLRAERFYIFLHQLPLFEWDRILIQRVLLRRREIGSHITVVQPRALALARFLDGFGTG